MVFVQYYDKYHTWGSDTDFWKLPTHYISYILLHNHDNTIYIITIIFIITIIINTVISIISILIILGLF